MLCILVTSVLRFALFPYRLQTYTFLKLVSLCSQFPLTIELILPLITFSFFFFYMHLCHSLDLFLCSFVLQFNVFCSRIWRDSFYLFYSTLYLFSVWIYKYVQIYNSNKQIAEAIKPNHSKTDNITVSNNKNKPNRLLWLVLSVQKRLKMTILKQLIKKPSLLVVFHLLFQYSSLTNVCLCV